ncbi:uncharacterized protein LOC119370585 [Jatropha curcas]|uniref:uncharacterized protein LOC119370585 n=1 Tax=Jatropha curcas TaxID=180498 RepID=UPI001893E14F|nr:uncharacterized protein LOC119370585 [Jatropha curcas]XP_037494950.1 uncharacterized protein LOC119370585 [Jatropha curcas]XP_037494951.1 uncharacterized protein LOC119370585 [Jatropha curcas]
MELYICQNMLISLKMLVIQRAKVIGYEELATKFDLKMLRALALVLMEHLKGNVEKSSHISDLDNSTSFMHGCSLLQSKLMDILSIQDLKTRIGIDERKKPVKRPREDDAVKQKK